MIDTNEATLYILVLISHTQKLAIKIKALSPLGRYTHAFKGDTEISWTHMRLLKLEALGEG